MMFGFGLVLVIIFVGALFIFFFGRGVFLIKNFGGNLPLLELVGFSFELSFGIFLGFGMVF